MAQVCQLDFDTLWRNYSTNWIEPTSRPCSNPAYKHQCAIRLSEALHRSGVDLSDSGLKHCSEHGERHIRGSNALRKWIEKHPEIFGPVDKLGDVTGADLLGFRGIIFIGDFWSMPGDESDFRDHIDLWNGEHLGSSDAPKVTDYIARSKDVRFWRMQ